MKCPHCCTVCMTTDLFCPLCRLPLVAERDRHTLVKFWSAAFTIIFAPDYSRQCRLRWRIGCEFGAEFTD